MYIYIYIKRIRWQRALQASPAAGRWRSHVPCWRRLLPGRWPAHDTRPVVPCSPRGRDVPLPPCALLWERWWCHRPASRLSFLRCRRLWPWTAGDSREGRRRDRAGGGKSDPALEEPAYPFVVQAAAGGKEKPLVQLGMKKRWCWNARALSESVN